MSNKYDISVNITTHQEGHLLFRTLNAIDVAIDNLIKQHNDLKVEVNISLDNYDELTHSIAQDYNFNKVKRKRLYLVNFGDLAESRNNLARISNGKYISFFDGDDIFSSNYLKEAYDLAESDNNTQIVYSVDYIVIFGDQNHIAKRPIVEHGKLSSLQMFTSDNPVNSCIFAHNKVFEDEVYEPVVRGTGYGYEDWHFHTKLYNKGYEFKIIPNTILFYRRDLNPMTSLLIGQVTQKAVLRSTPLFIPARFVEFYNNLKIVTTDLDVENRNDISSDNNLHTTARIAKFVNALPVTIKDYIKSQYHVNRLLLQRIGDKTKIRRDDKHFSELIENTSLKILQQSLLNIDPNTNVSKLLEQWEAANHIEPMIDPSPWNISNLTADMFPVSSTKAELYYELSMESTALHNSDKTCVFIAPWVTRGGADLILVNTIKALHRENYKIMLITTERGNIQWANKVNDYLCGNINIAEYKDKLLDYEVLELLSRFLINLKPKYFIGMHGNIEHKVAMFYNRQISENTHIFVHKFSLPKILHGIRIESPLKFYDTINSNNNVTVITDCKATIKDHKDIYGYGEDKFRLLTMPIPLHSQRIKSYRKEQKKIFWAGRISSDKLINEIIEIGNKVYDQGIQMYIYGTINKDNHEEYSELLENSQKVEYKGPFDSFDEIPVQDYDLMLFASISEGMPNIILEAIGANIFVVASNVGGIGEVIDSTNGSLVNNILNVDEYVSAIKHYYSNLHTPEYFKNMKKTNDSLIKNRSIDKMTKDIRSIYNI